MREISFNENGRLVNQTLKCFSFIKKGDIRYLQLDKTYYFNNVPYYIMQGKGSIEIDKLPHSKPIFDKIDLKNLDYFIQNKKHSSLDYDEQAQIESFCNISFFNDCHKEPKLYTQEYKKLEKALYGFYEDNKLTIKPY